MPMVPYDPLVVTRAHRTRGDSDPRSTRDHRNRLGVLVHRIHDWAQAPKRELRCMIEILICVLIVVLALVWAGALRRHKL